MKTLIDVQTQSKIPTIVADTVSVDSTGIHVLSGDDSLAEVRAEYLYRVAVDNDIKIAIVEDVGVAAILQAMGLDVLHVI